MLENLPQGVNECKAWCISLWFYFRFNATVQLQLVFVKYASLSSSEHYCSYSYFRVFSIIIHNIYALTVNTSVTLRLSSRANAFHPEVVESCELLIRRFGTSLLYVRFQIRFRFFYFFLFSTSILSAVRSRQVSHTI